MLWIKTIVTADFYGKAGTSSTPPKCLFTRDFIVNCLGDKQDVNSRMSYRLKQDFYDWEQKGQKKIHYIF